MKRSLGPIPLRAVAALSIALSVGVGGGMAFHPEDDGVELATTVSSPEFDSPNVAGMPMGRARRILSRSGYDVMVVGKGEVVLQELGFEGQLLRLQGERGEGQRYCDASAARCVVVPS